MSLQTRLTALATAVGGDIKALNGKVLTGAALLLDPWHLVGAVGEPPALNGWVNYGAPYSNAAFRKNPFGQVRLRGAVKNGTNSTPAFQLPSGYRPPADISFALVTRGDLGIVGYCQIQASTGNVYVSSISGGGSGFIPLDTVEFDTDTVTQVLAGPKGDTGVQGPTGGNATVPMDTWHLVGAVGQPVFQNSWVNWGSGEAALGFSKDPLGKVMIRGTIKGGANGTLIFTLPTGYRPPGNVTWTIPTASGASHTTVSVASTGGVSVSTVGTAIQATFITIEFDTETVTQMPTGPQGPKGDTGAAGGINGLLKDLDGLNTAPQTFRSKLLFFGPNFKYIDGGPSDGFGGGDYTKIEQGPRQQAGGALGTIGVRDGEECDLTVSPGVVWRMRYYGSVGWVMVGGAPLVYAMRGENAAYFALVSGNKIQVNASSKFLQWQFTPLVDVWAEVEFFIGLMQKVDANYHYLQMSAAVTPSPVAVAQDNTATITQHASVQQFESYRVKGLYALAAGVAYTMYCTAGTSGGSWQYHQAGNTIGMIGKAWPR